MYLNEETAGQIENARHLSAITRAAAAKAYETTMAARNTSMNWLLATMSATQSALLFFAATNRADLPNFEWVAGLILAGLIFTLSAGLAHVRFCNEYAALLYLDMNMEIEGVKAITEAKKEPDRNSDIADAVSSWCVGLSFLLTIIGAALAISALK